MPGGFQLGYGGYVSESVISSFASVNITTGTANTKTAWTELTSGLTYDAGLLYVGSIAGDGGVGFSYDIGIGSAGSEIVLIPDVFLFCNTDTTGRRAETFWAFPVCIPAGTRIAIRAQCSSASKTLPVMWGAGTYAMDSRAPVHSATTYGFNGAATLGTSFAPGNGTKGSWSELAASTTYDIRSAILNIYSSNVGQLGFYDIGVGAAGSEVAILNDFPIRGYSSPTGPFDLPVPAGTRLSVRGAYQSGTATAYATILGVN